MLDTTPLPATRRIPLVIATVVVGGLAGFAALYGLGLNRAPSGDPACRAGGGNGAQRSLRSPMAKWPR